MVDRQISHFDVVGETIGIAGRSGEGITGEPIGQRIGLLDGFVQVAHGIDQRQRTKRLLIHGARIVRYVGKNGEGEEIAAVADPASACENARAFRFGIGDECLHRIDPPRIRQRPHLHCWIKAIADLQLGGLFSE